MVQRQDYVALDWVKSEIDETLLQARLSLETFVENTSDTAQLRFCLAYIHQVSGSLQVVEFFGAALMCEEMELFCADIVAGSITPSEENLSLLMQGILQLPTYLERVKVAKRDLPTILLPLVNDFRTTRSEPLLSEAVFFNPDLSQLYSKLPSLDYRKFDDPKFIELLRKLRQMFQFALVGLFRGEDLPKNWDYSQKVFDRLAQVTRGTPIGQGFYIASAFIEGLANGAIDLNLSTKKLLKELDNTVKSISSGRGAALKQKIEIDLIKNLLFYISEAKTSEGKIQSVRKSLGLANTFQEGTGQEVALSVPDKETMDSVVAVLMEELGQIKDSLDIMVRAKVHEIQSLASLVPSIKHVADTMAMVGLSVPRRVLQEQISNINQFIESDHLPTDSDMMDIAGALLYVEASLSGINDQNAELNVPRLEGAHDAVINEARNGLEQTKEAITDFIGSHFDVKYLSNIPVILTTVSGGLHMIQLDKASQIILACIRYVNNKLIKENHKPDWSELDTFADSLMGVEYYLERLSQDGSQASDKWLEQSQTSISQLGFPVVESQDELPVPFKSELTEKLAEEVPVSVEAPLPVAELSEEEAQVSQPIVEPITTEAEDDDDLIDNEIIEIFIEEVEEVIEEININLPKYIANENDTDSLNEFRRAFHTLKGSGRMVHALVIGELAWAVEDMLNRLIEGSVARSAALLEVVSGVTRIVPGLVEDFKQQAQKETDDVIKYTAKANAIAKNEWQESEEPTGIQDSEAKAPADDSLISIFKSELEIHLNMVEERVTIDFGTTKAVKIRDSLQRALHTIQGSAQAANFIELADTAFAAESMIKDFQSKGILLDDGVSSCLKGFVTYVRDQLDHIGDGPVERVEGGSLLQQIKEFHESKIRQLEVDQDEPDVMELFMSANMDIILDAEQIVSGWQENGHSIDDIVRINKGLHELAVSAERVNLSPISRLSDRLVEFYNALLMNQVVVDEACYLLALNAQEQLINMIDRLAAGQSIKFATQVEAELESKQSNRPENIDEINDQFISDMLSSNTVPSKDNSLSELSDVVAKHLNDSPESQIPTDINWLPIHGDEELIEIFSDEAQDILEQINNDFESWKLNRDDKTIIESLQRSLHTLKGGARMSEISPLGDLSHELENLYESLYLGRFNVNDDVFELCQQCHDQLADMVQEVITNSRCQDAVTWTTKIQSFLHWAKDESTDQGVDSDQEPEEAEIIVPEPVVAEELADAELEETSPWHISLTEDMDFDILDIFIDEAAELLMELDTNIHAWQETPENEEYGDALKRVLHTIKGGARLAKLTRLGDASHEFESFVIKYLRENSVPDNDFFNQVLAHNDELATGIDYLEKFIGSFGQETGIASSVIAQVEQEDQVALPAVVTEEQESNVVPFAKKESRQVKGRGTLPQETVKVGASLLENLVNLAGETSITRSRLEQQVSDFGFTLTDMESTIDRLRDQVRRLDIETEAQVSFRQERAEESNYKDFDPLEMDRYSAIQQLSKSLMEATSDLFDLKSSLSDKTRDAETVLLQQSRINTELHEGLMQTRMVPFSRLVPRLRRIVRQIADETSKNVELMVHHAEGELDRSVLERMVSPLEHILRNAVDHGIELPETRIKNGKASKGRIDLTISREGGEAIIHIADDGAGIDVSKVRLKAIEKGLISADQNISDQDVLQFILDSGFSTADKVTQISGRGVGMDVVNSEVRALGGSIAIATNENQGTQFTIRLSVNVSVNRALMVRIGEDQYAIPLDTIEGIVRVSPKDLEVLLQPDSDTYEYAGKNYRVNYLGDLLIANSHAFDLSSSLPVPLILVKNPQSSEAMALHVDSLLGSREIVVKSLGPQFSDVRALSGATILGDGSVVVILDLASIVRSGMVIEARTGTDNRVGAPSQLPQVPQADRLSRILIVDDSVTVRKVTSRLLGRNGFESRAAKDGADAILIMHDYVPDLILLDIEMPRMDGFEVASRVRHDPRLQHIPIIMITSRTGSKHRERALSIGVNEYIGKPFQETPLLEKINELIENGRKP